MIIGNFSVSKFTESFKTDLNFNPFSKFSFLLAFQIEELFFGKNQNEEFISELQFLKANILLQYGNNSEVSKHFYFIG